jgi:hypothetical protein
VLQSFPPFEFALSQITEERLKSDRMEVTICRRSHVTLYYICPRNTRSIVPRTLLTMDSAAVKLSVTMNGAAHIRRPSFGSVLKVHLDYLVHFPVEKGGRDAGSDSVLEDINGLQRT